MNKTILAGILAVVIGIGGYIVQADLWIKSALAQSVSAYCKLPEPARALLRARIDADIAPNQIGIICAGE